jgi:hypothetical protein
LEFIALESAHVLEDRPFTHPELSLGDREVLQGILEGLKRIVTAPEGLPERPRPLVMHRRDPDGRKHRIVVCDLRALTSGQTLMVVGFLGARCEGKDPAPLDAIDEELIAGFSNYPGILSYCSSQQPGDNWANLVLMRGPEAVGHWASSPRHAFAAKAMAPEYYQYIRLHNGLLEGGLLSGNPIVLHRTKYYDYQGLLPWRAVRELPPQ